MGGQAETQPEAAAATFEAESRILPVLPASKCCRRSHPPAAGTPSHPATQPPSHPATQPPSHLEQLSSQLLSHLPVAAPRWGAAHASAAASDPAAPAAARRLLLLLRFEPLLGTAQVVLDRLGAAHSQRSLLRLLLLVLQLLCQHCQGICLGLQPAGLILWQHGGQHLLHQGLQVLLLPLVLMLLLLWGCQQGGIEPIPVLLLLQLLVASGGQQQALPLQQHEAPEGACRRLLHRLPRLLLRPALDLRRAARPRCLLLRRRLLKQRRCPRGMQGALPHRLLCLLQQHIKWKRGCKGCHCGSPCRRFALPLLRCCQARPVGLHAATAGSGIPQAEYTAQLSGQPAAGGSK